MYITFYQVQKQILQCTVLPLQNPLTKTQKEQLLLYLQMPQVVLKLKKMMKEYSEHGKTVFVTSHNIELVAKICDRVAITNEGKIAHLLDLNKDPNKRLQLPRLFFEIYEGKK